VFRLEDVILAIENSAQLHATNSS